MAAKPKAPKPEADPLLASYDDHLAKLGAELKAAREENDGLHQKLAHSDAALKRAQVDVANAQAKAYRRNLTMPPPPAEGDA